MFLAQVDADIAINAYMWQNGGHSGLDQWNFVMHPVYGECFCPFLSALRTLKVSTWRHGMGGAKIRQDKSGPTDRKHCEILISTWRKSYLFPILASYQFIVLDPFDCSRIPDLLHSCMLSESGVTVKNSAI